MSEEKSRQKRIPNLGKLSTAILENYIELVIGEKAIKNIKSPLLVKELRFSMANALSACEKRYLAEFPDNVLGQAILGLPLANLPSIREAIYSFYKEGTITSLETLIEKKILDCYQTIASSEIKDYVKQYTNLLREELVANVPEIRENW